MTAIFYPDCDATSSDRRLRVMAQSPHNGTINHRDGKPAGDDEFGFEYREHQSYFRYRLTETGGAGAVVWERWQDRGEDSPHELLVSYAGWVVIRTHGFCPELITVTPAGEVAHRVRLIGATDGVPPAGPDAGPVWALRHLGFTTAGHYWAGHSWPYYFSHAGADYFAWRTWWGQRLILGLDPPARYDDATPPPAPLATAADAFEATAAGTFLARLSPRMAEVR